MGTKWPVVWGFFSVYAVKSIGDAEGIEVVLREACEVDASVRASNWRQRQDHAVHLPVIRDPVTHYAEDGDVCWRRQLITRETDILDFETCRIILSQVNCYSARILSKTQVEFERRETDYRLTIATRSQTSLESTKDIGSSLSTTYILHILVNSLLWKVLPHPRWLESGCGSRRWFRDRIRRSNYSLASWVFANSTEWGRGISGWLTG